MAKKDVFLSREKYENMQRDLDGLKSKRMSISQDIKHARELGDISENAEYHAAKEAQAHNERKIMEIEDVLSRAKLLDDANIPQDEALLGATVTVKDMKNNETFDYILVSEEEADFNANKISIDSPVGKGLLGHKKGDTVNIKVPAGVLQYKITKISR